MHKLSASVIRPNGRIVFRAPANIRREVYHRDNFTCRDCGHQGTTGKGEGSIQAFHLKPIRDGGEHSLDNLITLCYSCRRNRERIRKDGSVSPYRRSSRSGKAKAASADGRTDLSQAA